MLVVGEPPMKMRIVAIAALLTALPMLLANGRAQTPPKGSTLTIAGHQGEAQLIQVNGKSYIDIEALARLTRGTLSFKANQTVLMLPSFGMRGAGARDPCNCGSLKSFHPGGNRGDQRHPRMADCDRQRGPEKQPRVGRLDIRTARLADKNLALASAAASTDDDRSAYPLLSTELNNMQNLSELYLAFRQQATFISPDTFHSSPLEDQILNCARGFVSMTESHEFQDQPACH